MTDMIYAPLFAELDAEREVVLEEIAMYEDTPSSCISLGSGGGHARAAGDRDVGRDLVGDPAFDRLLPPVDVRPGEHRPRIRRQRRPRAPRDAARGGRGEAGGSPTRTRRVRSPS